MMGRRTFLGYVSGMVGILTGPAIAQKAIMQGNTAVVCSADSGDPLTCPVCKKQTCRTINKPIAIGNDSYEYPDVAQLQAFHVIRCDSCHALFTRE